MWLYNKTMDNAHTNESNLTDEIDIKQLFQIFWQGKILIIGLIAVFSIAACSLFCASKASYLSTIVLNNYD